MQKVDFNDGKITKDIMRTALPMLLAQVLNLLYSIVDRVYIGRIPGAGTDALGAVGLCFPIVTLVVGFTNMFGSGGAPLFSMALGAGDRKKAADIQNSAFRLLTVSALLILVIGELFGGPILLLFGSTQAELPMALSYLRIYLIGTLFLMLATGMTAYITAQGYAMNGMIAVTIGAAANLILDPVFIFALGLGIRGAAIATVIAQCLSFLYVMRFFLKGKNEFPIRFVPEPCVTSDTQKLPASAQNISGLFSRRFFPYGKEIAGLGFSPFIMSVTNSVVQIVCNNVLMTFGGSVYVSVMTIVSAVRSILDTPALSFAEGATPVLSFNYGAKRPQNVRRAITVLMCTLIPYTCLLWLLIMLVPEFFVRIFSNDTEILADASRALHLYFLAFICQSFQYCGQTVFKSLRKKKRTVFFSVFRKIILVVPLTFALPRVHGLGTDGVFLAEPISNIIGGLACFITMLATILPELKRMQKKSG